MDVKNILAHCDHTLLKPESTWEQIKAICDEGLEYGCASVCNPRLLREAGQTTTWAAISKSAPSSASPTATPPPR